MQIEIYNATKKLAALKHAMELIRAAYRAGPPDPDATHTGTLAQLSIIHDAIENELMKDERKLAEGFVK